jgi:hypothetical protein
VPSRGDGWALTRTGTDTKNTFCCGAGILKCCVNLEHLAVFHNGFYNVVFTMVKSEVNSDVLK